MNTTTTSRFNVSTAVSEKAGSRSTTDLRAELTAERGTNSITINSKASMLIGLESGQNIMIFRDKDATDVNAMYAVAIVSGDTAGSAKVAQTGKDGAVGRPCRCSYAGIWSRMIQGTVDAEVASIGVLEQLGFAKLYQTMTKLDGSIVSNVLANRKVSFGVSEMTLTAEEKAQLGVERLFALSDQEIVELEAPTVITELKERKSLKGVARNTKSASTEEVAMSTEEAAPVKKSRMF